MVATSSPGILFFLRSCRAAPSARGPWKRIITYQAKKDSKDTKREGERERERETAGEGGRVGESWGEKGNKQRRRVRDVETEEKGWRGRVRWTGRRDGKGDRERWHAGGNQHDKTKSPQEVQGSKNGWSNAFNTCKEKHSKLRQRAHEAGRQASKQARH